MQTLIGGVVPEVAIVDRVLNFAISFLLITVLFAAIYKILPDRSCNGGTCGSAPWSRPCCSRSARPLIGLYIGSTAVASSFGAAGALAIVLLWVYYSSQIFLLGAEFTRAFAENFGSQSAAAPDTKP